MLRQCTEDLGRIQKMVFVHKLADVVSQQGQIEQEGEPKAIDQEQNSQETLKSGFRQEVRVQLVAEFDGVNVITLKIRVHNGEEHLDKQVDRIHNDGKNKQPKPLATEGNLIPPHVLTNSHQSSRIKAGKISSSNSRENKSNASPI